MNELDLALSSGFSLTVLDLAWSSGFQSTWAGVDSLFKFLDADGRIPDVQVCRFTNENFSQIMAEYVLGQVRPSA